ncbi:hypothetical protein NMY22_g14826 [Coprinellus aureogranulatus]|nr:hypothetical protein NMY22_g14826 [Coprinellus aureogranulatus]
MPNFLQRPMAFSSLRLRRRDVETSVVLPFLQNLRNSSVMVLRKLSRSMQRASAPSLEVRRCEILRQSGGGHSAETYEDSLVKSTRPSGKIYSSDLRFDFRKVSEAAKYTGLRIEGLGVALLVLQRVEDVPPVIEEDDIWAVKVFLVPDAIDEIGLPLALREGFDVRSHNGLGPNVDRESREPETG